MEIRNDQEVKAVEEYDPATDIWTRKADMKVAKNESSVIALNGKIYTIGNQVGDKKLVEVYDPSTDTWTRKADMPTPSFYMPNNSPVVCF